jgi:methylmalonyl-CoA/ethylmalonyl-CoA epimerase
MRLSGTFAALGPVMQMAFVPHDFDAAIARWTRTMGVGPFFLFEHIQLLDLRYMGQPTDAVFSLALAYWGDMQIELIRPEDEAPSIYTGPYGVRDCLHHVCVLVDDIGQARETCRVQGAEVVLEGRFGASHVVYADPGGGPGHLVELLERNPDGPDLFAMIRAAAQGWDGREPVRRLG